MSPLASSLRGIRVLDAARVLAGPYAAQVMADLGAEVIKVEQPGGGDETRGWGPPWAGSESAYFLACNRGKKSVVLDLKNPAGLEVFYRLAAASDVLVENYRTHTIRTGGLSHAELLKHNPRLVICSVSGFGRAGAMADVPGYDFVIQGMSGLMASTGPVDGDPYKTGVAVTDVLTGLYAVIGALAGLRLRDEHGQGCVVDLALFDCAAAAMVNVAQAALVTAVAPKRQGNAHLQIVPYQMFVAMDGPLILAVGNDAQWRRLLAAAGGCEELAIDKRFATNRDRVTNRAMLIPLLDEVIKTRTRDEWTTLLRAADVPCGPVWNVAEMLASGLAQERGLTFSATLADGRKVQLIGSPLTGSGSEVPPPAYGADSADVLRNILGLTDQDLSRLRAEKVIP